MLELRAKARRLKRDPNAKLGLVVVDYLQLMRSSEGKDSREQEISEISRSLKALAKELQRAGDRALAAQPAGREPQPAQSRACPTCASRAPSSRTPTSSCFIYREESTTRTPTRRAIAEIIIAKQRNGPTDTIELTFLREFTRFENREIAPDEAGGAAPM